MFVPPALPVTSFPIRSGIEFRTQKIENVPLKQGKQYV